MTSEELKPVAWRWRHRDFHNWHYRGTRPALGDLHIVEPLYAHPTPTSADTPDDALGYATRLLVSLMEKHCPDRSPKWEPLPDLVGVLTQLDNLSTCLMRKPEPAAADTDRAAMMFDEYVEIMHAEKAAADTGLVERLTHERDEARLAYGEAIEGGRLFVESAEQQLIIARAENAHKAEQLRTAIPAIATLKTVRGELEADLITAQERIATLEAQRDEAGVVLANHHWKEQCNTWATATKNAEAALSAQQEELRKAQERIRYLEDQVTNLGFERDERIDW